jgi:ribosomal protein L40E
MYTMKVCAYCGRENVEEAIHCRECGTQEFEDPATEVPDKSPEGTAIRSTQSEPAEDCLTKICAYCGRENDRDAVRCWECGTGEFKYPKVEPRENVSKQAGPELQKCEFRELTPEEMKLDLVTLLTCRNVMEADMVVARLGGVGISAFIPDEFLMQAMSWNVNAFGYVRVQVSPNDYETAKTFLRETPESAESGAPPNAAPPPL